MRIGDLCGNDAARRGILRALETDRLPHALLLHGPEGVGKRATALAIAQALLCPASNPDACDTCNVCRRVVEGIHPDLMVIEPDGQFIKIDAVRAVARDSYRRPFEAQAKVFLFPNADRFNEDSGNVLLKTLEEPPAETHLILVTSSREAVLATLRSRCQQIAFVPLTRDEVVGGLQDEGIAPAEAIARARRASGSMARARALDLDSLGKLEQSALDLLVPLARGKVTPAVVEGVLALAADVSRKDGPIRPFLFDVLRPLLRDALVVSGGGSAELLITSDVTRTHELASALGAERCLALLSELAQAEDDFVINANKKLMVESLLLGIHAS